MGAFLLRACSSLSKTITPLPSLMTNPSRSLSKGLLAFSGASFLLDKAIMFEKPMIPGRETAASTPPVMATSHFPVSMSMAPVINEWRDEAHALTGAKFGPFNPYSMAITPAIILVIIIGIRKGLTYLGPFLYNS